MRFHQFFSSINTQTIHNTPSLISILQFFILSIITLMENVPVNESSPKNTTPATSPQRTLAEHDQPPVETNTEGDTVLKTPEEVLAELTDDDDDLIPKGGDEGNEEDDGAFRTMVIALTADGSSVIQQVGSDGHVFKKRKGNQLKDPPSGSPTCPECKREFATWKAAFGHMRKHPERAHRGFFPPPTFSTVAPVPAEGIYE